MKPNEVVGEQTPVAEEPRAIKEKASEKAKPTVTRKPAVKPPVKAPTKATKPKPKPTKTTTKKPATNKTKNKTKTSEKSKPRAKGTLYGLSSLRRTGDVSVSIMADHTTVKSNFAVGPLILRVEKEVIGSNLFDIGRLANIPMKSWAKMIFISVGWPWS